MITDSNVCGPVEYVPSVVNCLVHVGERRIMRCMNLLIPKSCVMVHHVSAKASLSISKRALFQYQIRNIFNMSCTEVWDIQSTHKASFSLSMVVTGSLATLLNASSTGTTGSILLAYWATIVSLVSILGSLFHAETNIK